MITHITVEEAAKLISRIAGTNETHALTYIREAADRGEIQAATALSTLQAENEKLRSEAEGMRSNWYKSVEEIQKLRAELEQVKRERDDLIEDFVDYVTGGVPNPAIFCKNRCDKCTDMRGWCTGKDCEGFYPSGASGQKED